MTLHTNNYTKYLRKGNRKSDFDLSKIVINVEEILKVSLVLLTFSAAVLPA